MAAGSGAGRRLRCLYLEPYDAGSHAAFGRTLTGGVDADWTVVTLPGRHWKWRMRGSAAHAALARADDLARGHDVVFASAYLPLAELVGLVPALARVPRILYFHENQLAYPVRDEHTGERDLHYGFTQLVSALAADRCVFNSEHNRATFLDAGARLLRVMPDAVPPGWIERIASKSEVLPLPLDLPAVAVADLADVPPGPARAAGPLILWNHRLEYDKAPGAFFAALRRLADDGVPFRVALCGERFEQEPPELADARRWLGARVVHDGWLPDRAAYEALLRRCQLVVSTAIHEFFGVSVIEATHLGARPVVPDRLAYRETVPADLRYADDADLPVLLADLCRRWTDGALDLRADRRHLSDRYAAGEVLPRYAALLRRVAAESGEVTG